MVLETRLEVLTDLIALLGDARADDGVDARRTGAESLHRRHRAVDHATQRAFPAGVDGPDHPGLMIRHEDRRAVGGQDGTDRAGRGGHDGVAFRPIAAPGTFGHAGDGGVDLVAGSQILGRAPHDLGDPSPVLGHGGRIVAGADPGVQPLEQAGRDAALAGEEAVPDACAGQQRMDDGLRRDHAPA
jgi:hypothetical protein